MDIPTQKYYYKADFRSAYNANGHDIELALRQVSRLRDISVEHLRIVLKKLIEKIDQEKG